MRKIFSYTVGLMLIVVGITRASAQETYTAEKIVSELDGSTLIHHIYDPEDLLGKEAQKRIKVVSNAIYSEQKVCLHTVVLPTIPRGAAETPKDFLRAISTKLKSYADEEGRRRVVLLFVTDVSGRWAFAIDEQPHMQAPLSEKTEQKIVSTISADMETRSYGSAGTKAVETVGALFGMRDIEEDLSMEITLAILCLLAIAMVIYYSIREYRLLKRGSIGRYSINRKLDTAVLVITFVLCLPILPVLPLYLLAMKLLRRKYPIKYPCHNCGSMKGYDFVDMRPGDMLREDLKNGAAFYFRVTKFTLSCKQCGHLLMETEVEKLSGDHAVTFTREMKPPASTEGTTTTMK